MRKKKMIFAMIFLLFVFTAIGLLRIHSEAARKEYVAEYLENQYTGNFKLITCKKDQGKYILSFETKDSNKIQFQVKYWIGGYVTPWGKIPWIPQRHIVDDFSMQITNTIIKDSIVYDMTNKTIEEIISEIKSWSAIVQDYYDYYGLTWQVPEIGIRIKHNGKEEKIYYTNQNESVLRDSLYEAFY